MRERAETMATQVKMTLLHLPLPSISPPLPPYPPSPLPFFLLLTSHLLTTPIAVVFILDLLYSLLLLLGNPRLGCTFIFNFLFPDNNY